MESITRSVRGTIRKVFFAGPRFSAGRLDTLDGQDVAFAGNLFAVEGQTIALTGCWEAHPKYGRQFKVNCVEIEMPHGREGLIRFLANNPQVKGIGHARARKIVDALKDVFEEVLLNDPERVAHIAGVSIEAAQNLRAIWQKTHSLNSVMTWLSAFGLTHHQVTTLVEKLGNNVLAILKDDPYRIIHEIKGLGFKKIDQIARQMGTPKEHAPRIRAGITHCVAEALDQGDCWVDFEELIDRANTLLIMDCLDSRHRIEGELDALIHEGRLKCVDLGGRFVVSFPTIQKLEGDLARIFGQARLSNPHFEGDAIGHIDQRYNLGSLNEQQREAIAAALSSRISLISGGAGTGKTYTVSTLTGICEDHDLTVILAAPTGKATKRMQEASGCEAATIHRLLGYNGNEFAKGPENQIDADVLIVDEVSMLDVPLAWQLFQAIDLNRTAVVLVGDHNQLPPVGPGNILRDLVKSRAIPTTVLEKCVRQAGVLKENSTSILAGEVRKTAKRPDGSCDWYLVNQFIGPSGVSGCLREMFENILTEKLGFDIMRDVQVLTPTHKGPIGTQALNEELQRLVQRKLYGAEVPPRSPNRRPPLLKGDKVIQTRNDYELGVMNGSVGFVREVTSNGALVIEFNDRTVKVEKGSDNLRFIQLAYALTFHKCQGSEFPCAIVIIHKSHSFMHHRNLFYTGVTRARRTAVILGDRWGVRNCAARRQVDDRKTFLSQWLHEIVPAAAVAQ